MQAPARRFERLTSLTGLPCEVEKLQSGDLRILHRAANAGQAFAPMPSDSASSIVALLHLYGDLFHAYENRCHD